MNIEEGFYFKSDRTIHEVFAEEFAFSMIYDNIAPAKKDLALQSVGLGQMPDYFLLIQLDDYGNKAKKIEITKEFYQKAGVVKIIKKVLRQQGLEGCAANLTGLNTVICFLCINDGKVTEANKLPTEEIRPDSAEEKREATENARIIGNFAREIMKQVRTKTPYTVSVCYSRKCIVLTDYSANYVQMNKLLQRSFFSGKEQLIRYDAQGSNEAEAELPDSKSVEQWYLQLCVAFGQQKAEKEIIAICENILCFLTEQRIPAKNVRVLLLQLLHRMEHYAGKFGITKQSLRKENEQLHDQILTITFMEDFLQPLTSYFIQLSKMIFCFDGDKKHSFLQPVGEYISLYYARNLRMKEVADFCGYSEGYFSRRFKKEFGENFSAYLMRIRLEKAAGYLLETNKSEEEITELAGFHSTAYFCRAFKAQYHKTPGEYRKSQNFQ